ncbi:MAG: glucosaminidase domain-containing protein, partial [Pseudomonadales bacterium]|nr:glucosaminidase domain-containing protein [Pseudomonadales bacterium]
VDVPAQGPIPMERLDELLACVDVIPPSLVLAQAATESAWGTSRFARKANNLFGEWCFTAGCGLVPNHRSQGATHEVERFATVSASIDSYFHNLNSHPAYAELRAIRARAREAAATISGADLAAGLMLYSERGEDYVDELRQIIRVNDLGRFDSAPATRTARAD